MDRRTFALSLAATVCAPALARAAPVFLDYDQDALDKAYDQRVWAPNAQQVVARYASDSARARQAHPPRTERYGPSDAETLDIFAPSGASGLPVIAFIHGGAWRALTKDDASAPAPAFVANGAIYVALNFAVIPAVRLPEIAAQCRRALIWLHANIARFGGDPARLFVAGHSSGGHLCGVMATTDWRALDAPANLVKGAIALSGMYELYPVLLSARSSYVKLEPAEARALSPMQQLRYLDCPVLVSHGDRESPEFQRQSREFATVLGGMGRLDRYILVKDRNHFELVEDLNRPDTELFRATLAMMKR